MLRGLGIILFFAGGLLPVFAGCMATPDALPPKKDISVEVIAMDGQCFPAPGVWTATWILSPKQLQKSVSKCRVNRIGAAVKEVPSVDFDRFGVLAVEMGEQSSAGYGFDVDKVTAFTENRMATVILPHYQPLPGVVTAQVMTAPWILIRMPLGSYGGIQIMDQYGRMLTRISLP